MEGLEVSDFRLIARRDEDFKAVLNQVSYAAAKHALFAEKVCLGLFLEGSLNDACAGAANAASICKRKVKAFAGCVLLNCKNIGNAATFNESSAYQMSRSLWSHHEDINAGRRNDLFKMNVKAMCRSESRTRFKIRLNFVLIYVGLLLVGDKYHRYISDFNCFGNGQNFQALTFGDGFGFRAFIKSHDHINATIPQVQSMCVSLTAKADNSNSLAIQNIEINVSIIINFSHNITSKKN